MVWTYYPQATERIIIYETKNSAMAPGVYIAIIIASLLIRFVIKAAKEKSSGPPPFKQNPPYNNPSMKQPPPYIPSQQPTTDFSTLFEEQKSSYEQKPDAFTNTNSSTPSFKDPFSENIPQQSITDLFDVQKDSYSNIPSRNTNSNMGAGSQSYYCMYCGKKFQTTAALKMDTCFKHPKSDRGLQKHVLYTGMGKPNIGF